MVAIRHSRGIDTIVFGQANGNATFPNPTFSSFVNGAANALRIRDDLLPFNHTVIAIELDSRGFSLVDGDGEWRVGRNQITIAALTVTITGTGHFSLNGIAVVLDITGAAVFDLELGFDGSVTAGSVNVPNAGCWCQR